MTEHAIAGTMVAHYRVMEKLGSGGMGVVYRAEDTRLGRTVALKFLPPELARHPRALQRFQREARTASSLNHPAICTIHDAGTHGDEHFIVMELLEGRTLRQWLSERPLTEREVLDFSVAVADALDAAHGKGVLHRDVKPGNLFLTSRGQAKVLDFGLAKVMPGEASSDASDSHSDTSPNVHVTDTGVTLGTVAYMSPEQARGQELDVRSDLFSFGAVLYEMATGVPAFLGQTPAVVFDGILNRVPIAARTVRPELSRGLAGVIRKALEKDPDQRYQTAAELRADLMALQRDSAARPASAETTARPLRAPTRMAVALGGVAAIVAAILFVVRMRAPEPSAAVAPAAMGSLAVLPLKNLSGDPEQEYFADGMTDALIADLARIRALRVISATSAMRYKGTSKTLPEIARELKVEAVLEGSVLRSGERVRIIARLVDGATDRPLWSGTYERDLRDVLALQAEVARAVAQEVRVVLTPQEQARLATRRVVDPEAHRLHLKGRYHWNRRTADDFRKALRLFEGAIAVDPAYAPAYVGLADTYGLMSYTGFDVMPPPEAMPKAKAAARRALEIDDTLAEAHASLAWVLYNFDWDWPAAELEFRRAIELNPGYATAHHWYSVGLATRGRSAEALAEARRALELDPLSLIIAHNVARTLYHAGRFDDSIAQTRKVLEMDEHFPVAQLHMGMSLSALGRYREAVPAYERYAEASGGSPLAKALLAAAYARAGEHHRGAAMLRELLALAERRYVPPVEIALAYAGLGDRDRAFAWLEKAFEERSDYLLRLKVEPAFDPLREDPRFDALVKKVGL